MDLEMTGLDPAKDVIVEIATLVTDDELEIVAEGPDLVVHQPDEALDRDGPVRRRDAHHVGLLEAIGASTRHARGGRGGDARLHQGARARAERTVPLCGNSIGTDRRFLAAYLPEIEDWLHYRSRRRVDRQGAGAALVPRAWRRPTEEGGPHRALDDIRESVDELRYYRERVFLPPPTTAAAAPASAPNSAGETGDRTLPDVIVE